MVTMAEGFDRSILYDYFADFGFGETSAIEFLGEQPVQLRDPATLDDQTTANQIFGQGIAVTPMQMASSYLPFANEGKRPPVQLVSGCTNQEGETASPKVGDPVQVLKPETASDMNEMMEVMVNESDVGLRHRRLPDLRQDWHCRSGLSRWQRVRSQRVDHLDDGCLSD